MNYVKSHQEADEDFVCETHTTVCKELNAMVSGKCLYYGNQRIKLEQLKVMLERMIAGELEVLPAYTIATKHYSIHTH